MVYRISFCILYAVSFFLFPPFHEEEGMDQLRGAMVFNILCIDYFLDGNHNSCIVNNWRGCLTCRGGKKSNYIIRGFSQENKAIQWVMGKGTSG